jgi:Na+-transporting NADH:ubiquinone oxidoreductase subunit B
MSLAALVAVTPCLLFGLYNTGLQINQAVASGAEYLPSWQSRAASAVGLPLLDPANVLSCFLHGLIYFLPLWVVIHIAGRASDIVFAAFRREPLHEGFGVISLLFALTLHPNVPLWQAAVAILFGNIFGKEIFGGAGRNVIHPVVLAWNFLWIAYPASLSGDADWFPVAPAPHSWLNQVGNEGPQILGDLSWMTGFLGVTPGMFGGPAPLACLLGALILIAAGIASWRVVGAYIAGSAVVALLLNQVQSSENFFISVPPHWHMVLGSWAFGGAYLLTDAVTGSHTRAGRWIYGFAAGVFVILVRVLNPSHTDGTLAALLFVSLFAAVIDDVVMRLNIRRRRRRYEAA